MDLLRERLRSGQSVLAAAFGADGPLAAGSCQPMGGVAEITGVGVLPNSRRMGLGGAVTAALAREALRRGVQTVFLAASDDDVARVYARLGFAADRHRHDRRTRGLSPARPRPRPALALALRAEFRVIWQRLLSMAVSGVSRVLAGWLKCAACAGFGSPPPAHHQYLSAILPPESRNVR